MLVSAEGGGDFGDGGEGGGEREKGVEVVEGVIVDLETLAVAFVKRKGGRATAIQSIGGLGAIRLRHGVCAIRQDC